MMPELGNLAWGQPGRAGLYSVERDWQVIFSILLEALGVDCYATEYENDVFEMRPYYWGDCTCGADDEWDSVREHTKECLLMLPNFVYKPTGYQLEWYKYPLRDSYANMILSKKEFTEMILDCANSVEKSE